MSELAGRLVIDTLSYDGGRAVTAYVPPRPPEFLVYAGDGGNTGRWGAALEAGGNHSTIVVGAHGLPDETLRIHEYSPSFDPARFAAHESFFVDGVRDWMFARFSLDLPVSRTAVLGISAGGELALAMGLRHPEIYGSVFCASPGGGLKPPADLPSAFPRTYLVAGSEEPWFAANASRWADALGAAGVDVLMTTRAGGHGGEFSFTELPLMVEWALRFNA